MHGNYQVWPAARVEELIERWASGDSAGVIGAAMAMSRNAILGKAFRLGLASRKSKIPFAAKPQRRVFQSPLPPVRAEARASKPGAGFEVVVSPITGGYLSGKIRKRPRVPELSKTQLRAQLALAVINTGGVK